MYQGELREKNEMGLKYSDGHLSGGVRAIGMALEEMKKDGLLNDVEKENWSARLLDEWEEFNRFGLQEEE